MKNLNKFKKDYFDSNKELPKSRFHEGLFDSPKEAARDLKNSYNHAEKVNAYIVITD